MSRLEVPMPVDRLLALGRACAESDYCGPDERAALQQIWQSVLEEVPAEQRQLARAAAETLSAATGVPEPGVPAPATPASGAIQELMRRCAALELKLQTEAARCAELEAALRREQDDHKEAIESLSLQQRKIEESQAACARLMEDLSRCEKQLRQQISQTEHVQLQYEKLKSSRQSVSQQVTGAAEQINALKAENERLRQQVEAARQERDRQTADAQAATAAAQSRTASAAFRELWGRMQKELDGALPQTHVPDAQTFARACDVLVEFVRVFATLERHVHQMLRDLRQVAAEDDKLNRFHILLTKNPGLMEVLGDYVVSGRRRSNFVNLLRAIQAWSRAFATGLYKVVVKSPATIGAELNYRVWPLARSRFETEEACIGKYFKETVQRALPDQLGNRFRKQAADEAYEDYNTLMRRQA